MLNDGTVVDGAVAEQGPARTARPQTDDEDTMVSIFRAGCRLTRCWPMQLIDLDGMSRAEAAIAMEAQQGHRGAQLPAAPGRRSARGGAAALRGSARGPPVNDEVERWINLEGPEPPGIKRLDARAALRSREQRERMRRRCYEALAEQQQAGVAAAPRGRAPGRRHRTVTWAPGGGMGVKRPEACGRAG